MAVPLLNNRYRPVRPLGKGGFGVTVVAEDTYMPSKRLCVLKQLKPTKADPSLFQMIRDRFAREAAILEELSRANDQIPELYAYFTEGNRFYLVQELIDGETIMARVKRAGTLDAEQVTKIVESVLQVLDYVHGKGIIHRDIKPDNIILRTEAQQPVLIDFGAVKETMIHHAEDDQSLSDHSRVIGTPGYMPLEQGMGRPIFASDLYSLAFTAVFMLAAKHPHMLPHDPVTGSVSWQGVLPDLPEHLKRVLTKATEVYPRDRYTSARAMLDDMGDLHMDLLASELKRFRRRSE